MSSSNKILKFWNKNVVLITGVGIIIGIHWAWDRIQHTSLVPEKDRKDLPIIIAVKYFKGRAVDQYSSMKDKFLSSEQRTETKPE